MHQSPKERGSLAQTFPYFTASFFVPWNKDWREHSLSGEVHSGYFYLYIIAPPLQEALLIRKKCFPLLPWGRLPPEHLLVEKSFSHQVSKPGIECYSPPGEAGVRSLLQQLPHTLHFYTDAQLSNFVLWLLSTLWKL